jgi:hypothetical protein
MPIFIIKKRFKKLEKGYQKQLIDFILPTNFG